MTLNAGKAVREEIDVFRTELPHLTIAGYVLKLLGQDGLRIGTQLIHNVNKHEQ